MPELIAPADLPHWAPAFARQDPVLTQGVEALQREVHAPGLGGSLYAEAVAAQLALHLVRHDAESELMLRTSLGDQS